MKRDVLELRHRLAVAIACFPLSLAPMLTACVDHVQETAGDGMLDGQGDVVDGGLDLTDGQGDSTDGLTDGQDTADGGPDDVDVAPDVISPPGEEAFEVHYADEYCASGGWIMPQALAWERVEPGSDPEPMLDCPSWLMAWPPEGAGYTPLNGEPLRLFFNRDGTQALRDAGDARCDYSWGDLCLLVGRLLADEDAIQRLAPLREGADWMGPVDPSADAAPPLDPALRARLAAHWLQDAQVEHASIASFARATLELMRHGAPPALLAAAQQAAADEVDHAQRCLEQARRLGHAPQTFGPLDAPPTKNGTLAELAVDTLVEGCLGETIAITIATRGLERCEDPQARATLGCILDDETRHAALAWATVSWALRAGGEPVRQALMTAAVDIEAAVGRVEVPDADAAGAPMLEALAAHGRLEGPARLAASLDAWRGIIRPNLVALGLLAGEVVSA